MVVAAVVNTVVSVPSKCTSEQRHLSVDTVPDVDETYAQKSNSNVPAGITLLDGIPDSETNDISATSPSARTMLPDEAVCSAPIGALRVANLR